MKIILVFLFLITGFACFSQSKYMRINKTDGTSVLYPISDIKEIKFDKLVGINDYRKFSDALTTLTKLKVFPNPANSEVAFEFNLPEEGNVELTVYSNTGSLVCRKQFDNQSAGINRINWPCTDNNNNPLPNDIYYCSISSKNSKLFEKLIILK